MKDEWVANGANSRPALDVGMSARGSHSSPGRGTVGQSCRSLGVELTLRGLLWVVWLRRGRPAARFARLGVESAETERLPSLAGGCPARDSSRSEAVFCCLYCLPLCSGSSILKKKRCPICSISVSRDSSSAVLRCTGFQASVPGADRWSLLVTSLPDAARLTHSGFGLADTAVALVLKALLS